MKSGEIEKLIKRSLESGAAGQSAAKELISIGNEALPQIIGAMNSLTSMQYPVNLSKALHLIESPEKIPLLIDSLKTGKVEFLLTAFEILGYSRNPNAYLPLIEYLENTENLEPLRTLAADALGEHQDENSIPVLLSVLEQAESDDLRLSIIIALAKLGNNQQGSIALKLAVSKKDPTIRPKATEALKYLILPRLFETAQKVLKDKYPEMQINSINSIFYLGSKSCVETLVNSIKNSSQTVTNVVMQRLNDLTGVDFEEFSSKKIKDWWKEHESQFEEGICYRLGKPLSVEAVARLLPEETSQSSILNELQIITGINFNSEKFTEAERNKEQTAKVKKWLDEGGADKFASGRIYKYGREHDLETVFK